MSSIVTSILNSTLGLLWNKVRDSTAEKFKDGDVTDAEIRKFVVRELNDIKSKIDGLSRSTLLASYDFLEEGVVLLSVSLDKSNPEQKASETRDKPGEPSSVIQSGILNQAIELPRAMEKLKINLDREFETARERFKDARKTATTAFWNEAFSIEDRIFAAKLRIVSEILEHVDRPETAITCTGCLSFLKKLHSLPAIQEIFSVYLNGGFKSLLNKTQRVENVKSVMLINYVLFQYVGKFSSKYLFEVPACMPTIEVPDRSFHPIRNWKEVSTRKSMGEELPHPSYEQFLDEKIIPDLSAVNSQGDILTFPETESSDDIMIIHAAGKIKRVLYFEHFNLSDISDIRRSVAEKLSFPVVTRLLLLVTGVAGPLGQNAMKIASVIDPENVQIPPRYMAGTTAQGLRRKKKIATPTVHATQVEFEAIRGRSFYSDMALDDIHFTEMPCGVQHLGCFNDRYKRALPDLIANLRDKIDWYDMQKTVKECACVAYDKGYKYFAVQFYGECWGARSMIEYDKYGASNDCWSGVGKDFTNYVYKFTK
ncbi:uncharacterized protein LOC114529947 [Dendronephthya gigantea]|uniref:uncharacterized protein LOC114529947 n=1 Tax=Dendronephthya gigantea TaxID=151771 RepID=UPI00106922BC|nr:uncharacterized protein LOC114529947 [Dendronephthya gigantea]